MALEQSARTMNAILNLHWTIGEIKAVWKYWKSHFSDLIYLGRIQNIRLTIISQHTLLWSIYSLLWSFYSLLWTINSLLWSIYSLLWSFYSLLWTIYSLLWSIYSLLWSTYKTSVCCEMICNQHIILIQFKDIFISYEMMHFLECKATC